MEIRNGVKFYTLDEVIRRSYPDKVERRKFLHEVELERKKLREEYEREVAADLRKARQKLKITQQELANRLNVPRTQITRIESGRQNITIGSLSKVAHAMGKTLKVSIC